MGMTTCVPNTDKAKMIKLLLCHMYELLPNMNLGLNQ